MELFKGQKLVQGDYQLKDIEEVRSIGTGNSSVYSALINKKLVALKEIVIKGEEGFSQVQKEINFMKELSEKSDHIIKYEGCFYTVQQCGPYNKTHFAYIVMEQGLASLESLISRRIRLRKPFSTEEIQSILTVLLQVFSYLQSRGVAHCDIKPQNIIIMAVQPSIRVKICDIGSCKQITSEIMESSTIAGTVPFLAPELVRTFMHPGQHRNTFQSDVYSLGLCLLYLITWKKFKQSDRLKVNDRVYSQIMGQWIKEANEKRCYDRVTWELLDKMLQFQESKRVDFIKLLDIYMENLKLRSQQKQKEYRQAELKKMEEFKEIPLIQPFSSCQDTFVSKRQRERSKEKDKSLTKTNGFKTRTKFTKLDSQRSQKLPMKQPGLRLQMKEQSQYRLPRNPISIILPLQKRSSLGNTNTIVTEASSPTKSKHSIHSVDLSPSLIIVNNRQQSTTLQDYLQALAGKHLVLNTAFWGFQSVKALSINKCQIALSSLLNNFTKIHELSYLHLNLDKYDNVPLKIQDIPDYTHELTCLRVSARNFDFSRYGLVFRFLFNNPLKQLWLDISGEDIQFQKLIKQLSVIEKTCEKLTITIEQSSVDGIVNRKLMENLARWKLKLLRVRLMRNNIVYQKQVPWPLSSTLGTLQLDYSQNSIGIGMNSLALQLKSAKEDLKQLKLGLRRCRISNKQLNCLFKCLSTLQLQTLILDLSLNQIDDSAIRFMIQPLSLMTNLVNFQFCLNGTLVTQDGWASLIQSIDRLFKFRLSHVKVSYDRFNRRQTIIQKARQQIRPDTPIVFDFVFLFNERFDMYLRKKQPPLKDLKTRQFCGRLFSNTPSSTLYLCLTCKDKYESLKTRYFCEFCATNCGHRTHNLIRIYGSHLCCCAFSGQCQSKMTNMPCSRLYSQVYQKKYRCLKCDTDDVCASCIQPCKQDHEYFTSASKDPGQFLCCQPQHCHSN